MSVDYEEGRRLDQARKDARKKWRWSDDLSNQALIEIGRAEREFDEWLHANAEALLNPDPWRPIEELPEEWKDGRWIEAVVADSADDGARLTPGRVFVIRHDGVTRSGHNLGWSVYPGYGGAHDRTFSHFRELKGPGQ